MTTPGHGSDPDRIRRDIERTQDALSSDVDALSEKVSPGRIVERRVDRVSGAVRGWKDKVMGSDSHGPAHTVTGTHTATHSGGARDTAHHVAGAVSDTAASAGSGLSDAASSATDAAQQAPRAVRRQAQGNPIAAGLIAFGAGWLVSSLLPASRREQDLAEQAKDRAGELGRPAADAAKQAATEIKDNLAGPAQQAVGSVRSTAAEAGQTVTDEGRSAAEHVQERARDSAGNVRQNASG